MPEVDWGKIREEEQQIRYDVSKIKATQRQENLERIKRLAREQGKTETVRNIEQIQQDIPEGTRVSISDGTQEYTGVVSELPTGRKLVGFKQPSPTSSLPPEPVKPKRDDRTDFYSIDPRVQPPQTSQQRAEEVAQNIAVKSAMPITTRGVPVSEGRITFIAPTPQPKEEKVYTPKQTISGFGKGAYQASVGFIGDTVKGGGQLLGRVQAEAQLSTGVKDYSKAPGWVQNFYGKRYSSGFETGLKAPPSKEEVTFGTVVAVGGLPVGAQGAIYKGFTAYSGYQFVKEPTPERAGEFAFLLAAPKIAKAVPKAYTKFKTVKQGFEFRQLEKKAYIKEPYENIKWTGTQETVSQRTLYGLPIKKSTLTSINEPVAPQSPIQTRSGKLVFGGREVEGAEVNLFLKPEPIKQTKPLIGSQIYTREKIQPIVKYTESGKPVLVDMQKAEVPYYTEMGNIESLKTKYAVENIPRVETKVTQLDLGKYGIKPSQKVFDFRGAKILPPEKQARFRANELTSDDFRTTIVELEPTRETGQVSLLKAQKSFNPKPELIYEKKYQTAEYGLATKFPTTTRSQVSFSTFYPTSVTPISKRETITGPRLIIDSKFSSRSISAQATKKDKSYSNIFSSASKVDTSSRQIPKTKLSSSMDIDTAIVPKQITIQSMTPIDYPPTFEPQRQKVRPRPPKPIRELTPPPIFDFKFLREPKKEDEKKAYVALLKRKGKYKRISAPVSFGAALDIGAKSTLSNLGASFKVRQVSGTPYEVTTGGEYSRYKGLFRPYKIKKGQRQYLQNEFIQKRGTRLSTFGEVSEIQTSKKNKLRMI